MGAMLRLIRMDTTLQGPMFMHTLDPMSMCIPGIIALTIRTDAQVGATNPLALLDLPV